MANGFDKTKMVLPLKTEMKAIFRFLIFCLSACYGEIIVGQVYNIELFPKNSEDSIITVQQVKLTQLNEDVIWKKGKTTYRWEKRTTLYHGKKKLGRYILCVFKKLYTDSLGGE